MYQVFLITTSNNGLDPTELSRIAQTIGIDKTKFINCLASKKYDDRIAKNQQDGIDSCAEGTPYSIIFTPKGNQVVVSGAQHYEDVKKIIDQALAE